MVTADKLLDRFSSHDDDDDDDSGNDGDLW